MKIEERKTYIYRDLCIYDVSSIRGERVIIYISKSLVGAPTFKLGYEYNAYLHDLEQHSKPISEYYVTKDVNEFIND